MLCAIIPLGAFPAFAENGSSGISYSIDGTKLTISGNGYMEDYAYRKTPWYYNKSRKEYGCNYITDIEIKEGVKSICKYAFYDFDELVNLTLPSTLEYIGYEAFYHSEKIEKIVIPNPVNTLTIGNEAFMCCYNLKGLQVGDLSSNSGKIILDKECFENCEALETVFISKNVSSIKGEAFNDCYKLNRVYCYPSTADYNWNIVDDYYNSYFINAEKSILPLSLHYYADRVSNETNALLPYKVIKETVKAPSLAHNERFHWYSSKGDIVFKECHTYENGRCKYCGEREKTFSDPAIDFGVTNLTDGYYVVNKITDLGDSTIYVDGHVNIIVKDNCGLYLRGGILLKDGSSLSIYAEHIDYDYYGKMGYIRAENSVNICNPGIGSQRLQTATEVNIYGGNITAKGYSAAGIGTYGNSTTVNIIGGIIKSYGDFYGAGIGSSNTDTELGTEVLYPILVGGGGDVTTQSSANIKIISGNVFAFSAYGAGIGNGMRGDSTVRIYGGYIDAGSIYGCGIGSSYDMNGSYKENLLSDVYLYGGTICADTIGGNANQPSRVIIDSDFSGMIIGKISKVNTTFIGDSKLLSASGSIISDGSFIIIFVFAGVTVAAVAAFIIIKKKKKTAQ